MPRPLKIPQKKLTNHRNLGQPNEYVKNLMAQGITLYQEGEFNKAEAVCAQILKLHPKHFDNLQLLGMLTLQLRQYEKSVDFFNRALEINQNHVSCYINRGIALNQIKRLEEAEKSFEKAISINSNNAEAYCNQGNTLQLLGRFEEAMVSCKRAISINPKLAEAHFNLGNSLHALERYEEAISSLKKAISLKPNLAEAYSSLAVTLKDLDRFNEAFSSVVRSIRIKPTIESKRLFVNISRNINLKSWDTLISDMVTIALTEPWARPSEIMGFANRILKLETEFQQTLNKINEHLTVIAEKTLFDSIVEKQIGSSKLLNAMLTSSYINDIELENFFTRMRRNFLEKMSTKIIETTEIIDIPPIYCYLAQQCFINEYIYTETKEEINCSQLLLNKLSNLLERDEIIPASLVITVASYFPLYLIPNAKNLLKHKWNENVARVINQQVREPLAELDLQVTIPCLTKAENLISLDVKKMYEENPYPRWVKHPKEESSRLLNTYIHEIIGHNNFRLIANSRNPRILVAGCGTGQHSIGTAQLISGATVLAVDLSITSLSYAKRKTAELGINNIEYGQADLLKLGSLSRTFDVIESTGVLHHLEDPFKGWKILSQLLEPYGLMRLGLYSEIARRDITRIRKIIDKERIGSSTQEMRNYRRYLLGLKNSESLGFSLQSNDFFSMSAFRDLLFHVNEHHMTLPIIAKFLHEHNFNFLGFDINPSVKRSYRKRFPNDPLAIELNNWHIYEMENPNTFISMYQFWIQKSV